MQSVREGKKRETEKRKPGQGRPSLTETDSDICSSLFDSAIDKNKYCEDEEYYNNYYNYYYN